MTVLLPIALIFPLNVHIFALRMTEVGEGLGNSRVHFPRWLETQLQIMCSMTR